MLLFLMPKPGKFFGPPRGDLGSGPKSGKLFAATPKLHLNRQFSAAVRTQAQQVFRTASRRFGLGSQIGETFCRYAEASPQPTAQRGFTRARIPIRAA